MRIVYNILKLVDGQGGFQAILCSPMAVLSIELCQFSTDPIPEVESLDELDTPESYEVGLCHQTFAMLLYCFSPCILHQYSAQFSIIVHPPTSSAIIHVSPQSTMLPRSCTRCRGGLATAKIDAVSIAGSRDTSLDA